MRLAPPFNVRGFLLHPQAATLVVFVRRRLLATNLLLAANLLGGQRSRRKSSSDRRWGTEPLSKRTDFNSAGLAAVVVFVVAGLNRGNSPGHTERDSGNCNQHLLPAHC